MLNNKFNIRVPSESGSSEINWFMRKISSQQIETLDKTAVTLSHNLGLRANTGWKGPCLNDPRVALPGSRMSTYRAILFAIHTGYGIMKSEVHLEH
jgi:hypothetical protein